MNLIPVHDFSRDKSVPGFEIEHWGNVLPGQTAARPHRHKYFEALFFIKGKGEHEIDFTTYEFKPYSIHFVQAASVHMVRRLPGSSGFSILFSPEFFPPASSVLQFDFFKTGCDPVLNLGKVNYTNLIPLLDTLQKEYNDNKPFKRELLQSVFQAIMIHLQRYYQEQAGAGMGQLRKNEQVRELEDLIEKHHLDHWRVGEYASTMKISVSSLSALTKKYFSLTAQQYIQQRILLEIKRRLAYSGRPVKEICFDLNFEDPAYFNRFFKTHTGLTPQQYREALNE